MSARLCGWAGALVAALLFSCAGEPEESLSDAGDGAALADAAGDSAPREDAPRDAQDTRADVPVGPCGKASGAPCCEGSCEAPNLACVADVCEPCGQPGQPCCANGACAGSACCIEAPSNVRGPIPRVCVAVGDSCRGYPVRGACSEGRCALCGGYGQPCCVELSGPCHEGRCYYPERICEGCGGVGQRCCEDRSTLCDAGLTCGGLNRNRCDLCGGVKQPCCGPESRVESGAPRVFACGGDAKLVCTGYTRSDRCVPCGKIGNACCSANLCDPGAACVREDDRWACRGCGQPGQPCCPGNVCQANGCCVRDAPGDNLEGQHCVAPGQACPAAVGGMCDGRTCGTGCGQLGGACCPYLGIPNLCTEMGTACVSTPPPSPGQASISQCQACGGPGQPCCHGRSGSECRVGACDSNRLCPR
jgi:hypothetical protein